MSATTAQHSVANQTVSVALYGGPLDLQATEDTPNPAGTDTTSTATHIGIAVHAATKAPPECHLHHARCPSQIRFIYDPRPAQSFFGRDPVLRGRCELATLRSSECAAADRVLAAFGQDERNLPWFGEGNCHDWTAGAVKALEDAGLVEKGSGTFWAGMIGKGPVAMSTAWRARGGIVVFNEKFALSSGEPTDARWSDREERQIGKLGEDRMMVLAALLAEKEHDSASAS